MLATVSLTVSAQSAPKEWAWIGGSNSVCTNGCGDSEYGHLGVYGILGVPAAGNMPGSRFGSATWTGSSGHLWLFGGLGIFDVENGSDGYFNDFWEFDPVLNEWAWMGGSTSPVPATGFGQPGVYGTLGVPDGANIPGGRVDALTWTDHSGHFWLFGGIGSDSQGNSGWLNDLWEFDPTTNQWTWVSGSSTMVILQYGKYGQPGIYGTLGVPAVGNVPGGHAQSTTWADDNGNLWLFSGGGFDADGNSVELNDLWKFNIGTNEWAWMGGVSVIPSSGMLPGIYGTLGTAAAGNIPGARDSTVAWTDGGGNLWLFGGVGSDVNGTHGFLNDGWKFNPSKNEWAWMGGSSTLPGPDGGLPGMYGTKGTPAFANIPGSRYAASSWTDNDGKFWMLGGEGFDGEDDEGILNDLWEFDPSTGQWTWVDGNSILALHPIGGYFESGIYGTLGLPASGNLPGSRSGAVSWTGNDGYLWLFGGDGFDASANGIGTFMNDLWRYQPLSATPATATPNFNIGTGTYTAVQSITISDATSGATIYYTTNGTTPDTTSSVYNGPITVSSTETLEAIATASGYSTSSVTSALYTINLPPGFTLTGTAVTVAPGATIGNTSIITLTPSGGFTGSISLSCTITPTAVSDPATCSIPASVTISGSTAQTTTLTVSTTGATAALKPAGKLLDPSAGAAFACILLIGIPVRRKRQRILGMTFLFFAVTSGLLGCGGGGNGGGGGGNPGTTAGHYTITVTGNSGTTSQTGMISLTVQ